MAIIKVVAKDILWDTEKNADDYLPSKVLFQINLSSLIENNWLESVKEDIERTKKGDQNNAFISYILEIIEETLSNEYWYCHKWFDIDINYNNINL